MSFLQETPADARRRAGLRRMRAVATGLLVLAALIYVATLRLDHDGVWGFVNTAAEAAMVGALADWFAVTALFKHPLGLPIPHTALVKRRKDELGRSLQEFVASNFLTEEIARERLASAQVGLRLGRWLERPESRERVMRESVSALRAGLHRMQDSDVEDFLTDLLLPRLAREPISPIAGSLLEKVVEERTHDGLVDLGLDQVLLWLRDNPEIFAEVMVDKAPWWTPNSGPATSSGANASSRGGAPRRSSSPPTSATPAWRTTTSAATSSRPRSPTTSPPARRRG